jgi:hypothetical protein
MEVPLNAFILPEFVIMSHVGPSEIAGPEIVGIADDVEASGVKQRQVFLVGLIVAAVPILCQLTMLAEQAAAPDAFPAADRTFTEARFWPIRIVLLCVAVAGWCRSFRVDDMV